MVKYNWEEQILIRLGLKKPKTFKRDARNQIIKNTLIYIKKFGRTNWVPVGQIFEDTLLQTDLFNSKEGNFWFASQGIKSKINSATHELRRKGEPIISGKGNRGYRYADEECDGFIDVWDEAFSGWEKRKTALNKEKKNHTKLIEKIIERLIAKNRLEEAEKLKLVLVQYQR